jgi:hypothetical protein
MLSFVYEKEAGVLVVNATGAQIEEDVPAYQRALVQLDKDAISAQVTPVTIFVVAPDAARPDAKQRQELAELWNHTRAPLHLFALVTTSSIDRGIMKVISWISPPGNRRRESVHATFAQALSWSRSQRKEPIPDLSAIGVGKATPSS